MKTKNFFLLVLCTLLSVHIKAANGDTFTANTKEGVAMTFKILNENYKTVQVGNGSVAIPSSTSGIITVPSTVTKSGVTYSVVSIGDVAFYACKGITCVVIENNVRVIGKSAFWSCSGITRVHIPNSVTSIGEKAFAYCSGLTNHLSLPKGVESIGNEAFAGCSNLASLNIPNSVSSIGEKAFNDCSKLSKIETDIEYPFAFGASAFNNISYNCVLTVPMGKGTAYNAAGWTTSVFKGGVTEGNTFTAKTPELVDMEFKIIVDNENEKLVQVGDGSVSAISASTSGTVTLPTTITHSGKTFSVIWISQSAFQDCSNLTAINIPAGITSIAYFAFSGCCGLKSIKVDSNNTKYDSRDNCNAIIEKASNTLVAGCTNTVIPNSVTSIGREAFEGRSQLTSITIPNTITSIDVDAFRGCSGLTSITIPNSVTSIGSYAFQGCSGLTSVISKIETPFVCYYAFDGISPSCTLTIPAEKTNAYIAAGWTESVFKGGIIENDNRKTQSMTLTSLPSMTYGAANYALPTQTTQGLTLTWASSNTGVATISGNTLTVKGAGTAAITASQAGNEEYKPFSKEFALTVAKAPLTITAQDFTRYEGEENPAFTVSYEGFVKNEDATVLTAQPVIATTATVESAAGTYPITVSGATAANYEITFVAGTLTVQDKSTQTIVLTSLPDMTYGGDAYTLPAQTEEGFDLTWASSNTAVATISGNTLTVKGAGTAAITASQAGNEEYKPFSKEFALTVAKAPLTITAQDFTRYEGEENPAFTVSYEGFVKNEDATVLTAQPVIATTATVESAAGTYPITVSGATAANYEITFVAGTLTVQDKSTQTIVLTSLPDMTYGGDAYTLPAQTEEGFDLTWASSNTAVATISGNTLTVKGAGTAAITASQAGNEEYKPFSKEFTLTVAKAPLTITANDATKNVGEENPAFTASYEGFVGDDDASVLTAQPTFTTEADENSPVGTYAIVVSGAEAANYEISYVNGTLTVVDEWSMNNTLALTDTQVLCGRQVVLPVSMSNTEDITALQFDLTLPAGVSIATNTKGKYIVEKTERCADHTLSASKPGEANVYKVLLYSTEVESITGNEGAVINVTLEATEDMEAGDYEVTLSNINLTTTAEKKITPADVTCVLTVRNSIPGDANGDGTIDVTDIVGIANSILGRASESFDAVAADVNGDGSVDVTDIVVTANIILHDGGANAANVRGAMQMLDPQ